MIWFRDLLSFEKRVIAPLGTLLTRVKVNNRVIPFVLHVVETCNSPLLSLQDSICAGLVSVPAHADTNCSAPPDEINEFNAYNKEFIHLELRSDAVPKQFPPRRVALALQAQTQFEL